MIAHDSLECVSHDTCAPSSQGVPTDYLVLMKKLRESARSGMQAIKDDPRRIATRAGLSILRRWNVADADAGQILGGVDVLKLQADLDADRPLVNLPQGFEERIGYLLGIYKSLHTLFTDSQQADGWIKKPNTHAIFAGESALCLLASGEIESLAKLFRYIRAQTA